MKHQVLFKFILLQFLFVPNVVISQKFDWAKKFESTGICFNTNLSIDSQGNLITVLETSNTNSSIDMDLGPGTAIVGPNNYYVDILAKYDSLGNLLWYLPLNDSSKSPDVYSLTTNSLGEIYLCLGIHDTMDIDPGPGVSIINCANNITNLVLCKFSVTGALLWYNHLVRTLGANYHDDARGISLDNNENIIIGGKFYGIIDLDPGPATAQFISTTGTSNAFIAKYSPTGSFIFGYGFGASQNDEVWELDVDENNNIIAIGDFQGNTDFDKSTAVNSLSVSYLSPFILKLANDGSFKWVKTHGTSSNGRAIPLRVEIDKLNNILISGHCKGTTNLAISPASYPIAIGTSNFDIYIQKLDSMGNYIWAHRFGNTNSDQLGDMALDTLNNLYLIGYASKSIDLDRTTATYQLPTQFNFNVNYIYLAKFNPNGIVDWARDIRGNGGADAGRTIEVNQYGQVYSFSQFTDSVDVNTDSDTLLFYAGISSPAPIGIFMHRIAPCQITYDSISVTNCGAFVSPSGKYVWNTSGVYRDIIENQNGCDSVITINLTITSTPTKNLAVTGCNSYTSPYSGVTYYQTGVQQEVIINPTGCDTLVNLSISFLYNLSFTSLAVCQQYTSPTGNIYTQDGYYYDTLTNQYGCDSIIRTQLWVHNNVYDTLYSSTCNNYQSPSGNYVWNQSGTYNDTIPWIGGCNKFYTIYLTILPNSSHTITETACDSYTTSSNLHTYTQNGTYTETFTNAIGCDSIITYNLTFNYSNYGLQTLNSCSAINSPSGNYSYAQTGVYYDTLQNIFGCDSIVITDFTLDNYNSNLHSINACNSFTSPSGDHTWTQSGIYHDTLTNINGCDSIIHFDLNITNIEITIIQTDTTELSVQNPNGSAGYGWYDCTSMFPVGSGQLFEPFQSGSYFVVGNLFGCIDTSACFTISFSLADITEQEKNSIQLYPNPANNSINLKFEGPINVQHIHLVQIDGKILSTIELNGQVELQLDIMDLNPGLYFVEFGSKRLPFIKLNFNN